MGASLQTEAWQYGYGAWAERELDPWAAKAGSLDRSADSAFLTSSLASALFIIAAPGQLCYAAVLSLK